MAASGRIAPYVVRTPLIYSPRLSEELGADMWVKPEHFQLTGSFKVRGAFNKMLQLTEGERARGIITASAGNHAQGVALAAQMLGITALIVAPDSTPATKIAGIRQYGADVTLYGAHYDEAERYAFGLAEETGRAFVHAFEDEAIVAGQGTVGLELFQDQPAIEQVFVPAGGGGLMCGIGVAARAMNSRVQVVGVQSEASPAWHAAYEAGKPVDVIYQDTWAEGLLGGIGSRNFVLARRVVDRIGLVREQDIQAAMRWALDVHHWVIEGSGAVALAWALVKGRSDLKGTKSAIVLTGGNLDIARLRWLLSQ